MLENLLKDVVIRNVGTFFKIVMFNLYLFFAFKV